jgi:hypothetical protein
VFVIRFGRGNPPLQCAQCGVAIEHELQCRLVGGIEFLCDMRHFKIGRHLEMTGIGLQLALYQRHEAGLAAAVLASDADLLALEQAEAGLGKRTRTAAGDGIERMGARSVGKPCAEGNRWLESKPMKNAHKLLLASLLLLSLPAAAEIVAEQGWVRATVPGAKAAAGYVTLRNTGSETRKLLR